MTLSSKLITVEFKSDALGEDDVEVVAFRGREGLSALFRFEIDLLSSAPDLPLDTLLGQTASLTIRFGETQRTIHGVLETVEQHGAYVLDEYVYRVVLVPRVSALCLSEGYQIHLDKSVPDIVRSELSAQYRKGLKDIAQFRPSDSDFSLTLRSGDYETYDYRCQFAESDFAFISRLLEEEGIFYYFDHTPGFDKLVMGDDLLFFPAATTDLACAFQGEAAADALELVSSFHARLKRLSETVATTSYTHWNPQKSPAGQATAVPQGVGAVQFYGEPLLTEGQAGRIAKVRAQEIAWQRQVFEGESNNFLFEPGRQFKLEGHFRGSFDATYRIVTVEHACVVRTGAWPSVTGGRTGEDGYWNTFTAIPGTVDFRPRRVTPKPRIPGVVSAFVDGEGSWQQAQPDSKGRYKVRMPFDPANRPPGKASAYIRVAAPLSGAGEALQAPLRPGTEVLVAHQLGDPDLPVIVGTVTNAFSISAVSAGDPATARFALASGVRVSLHDNPSAVPRQVDMPANPIAFSEIDTGPGTPGGGYGGSGGSAGGGGGGSPGGAGGSGGGGAGGGDPQRPPARALSAAVAGGSDRPAAAPLPLSAAASDGSNGDGPEHVLDQDKSFAIYIPDYASEDGDQLSSYLRIGGAPPSEAEDSSGETDYEVELDKMKEVFGIEESAAKEVMGQLGWFDFTDGGRVSLTEGMKADRLMNNGKKLSLEYSSAKSEKAVNYEYAYFDYDIDIKSAKSLEVFTGQKTEVSAAGALEIELAAKSGASLATEVSYKFGAEGVFGAAASFEFVLGPESMELHNDFEKLANKISLTASLSGWKASEANAYAFITGILSGMTSIAVSATTGGEATHQSAPATEDVLTSDEQSDIAACEGTIDGGIAALVTNTVGALATYGIMKGIMEATDVTKPPQLELDGTMEKFELKTGTSEITGYPTSIVIAAGEGASTVTVTGASATARVGGTILTLTDEGLTIKAPVVNIETPEFSVKGSSISLTAGGAITLSGTSVLVNGAEFLPG